MDTPSSTEVASTQRHMDALSRILFRGYSDDFVVPNTNLDTIDPEIKYVAELTDNGRSEFLRLANIHHVTVRTLQVLEKSEAILANDELREWCGIALSNERSRINHAVENLQPICTALEASGSKVIVIKSLDHWPDLGSDLDLYTTEDQSTVVRVMAETFRAKPAPRSWGDCLANKWNFVVPGLPELVEIHVRYLGQTGEQKAMADRMVDRRISKTINGNTFYVPAPEHRVIISTLQRMYRHFYFRLCDMADFAALLQSRAIDFVELKNTATLGGIWPGVATFLLLVSEYVKAFGGDVEVPHEVLAFAHSKEIRVYLGGDFLRVPKKPAAWLYASQLMSAARHVDLRAMGRLPLLPPLAVSALVAFRLTGSDKGVW
jgi:Uncharacterised nucleotidyltransferase